MERARQPVFRKRLANMRRPGAKLLSRMVKANGKLIRDEIEPSDGRRKLFAGHDLDSLK